MSGSSSPLLFQNITESLAGRVALFELSPFVWSESWNKNNNSFYDNLLSKKFEQFSDLEPVWTRKELMESLFHGGYPEPFLKRADKTFFNLWMQNYFETYIKRDIRNLFPGLALTTYQRFIKMLASSSGNLLNMSEFARSLDVSQPTIKNYFDIADGTFLWRNIPAFHANKIKSSTRMPKGYIRDSGLMTFLMNIYEPETLQNHVRVGLIWECFVMEQIIRSLKSRLCSFEYFHYRTKNNVEIDFILKGPFGLIPVEIKYGQKTDLNQLRTLKLFVEQNHCAAGLVVNLSDKPLQLSEKIYQVPAYCL
jgi:predicted AAA+ superfamily ATPase